MYISSVDNVNNAFPRHPISPAHACLSTEYRCCHSYFAYWRVAIVSHQRAASKMMRESDFVSIGNALRTIKDVKKYAMNHPEFVA
jgi:hypothetical protein